MFDLRFNHELVWHDDSRFYKPSFVCALPNAKENNVLTLDRNGIGELTHIENEKSFVRNGKRFAIPLQANASICAYEIDSSGDVLLTADRNGYLHRSSLKAAPKQRPSYRLSSCPIVESSELSHTKHVRIADIVVRTSDGRSDACPKKSFRSDESLQSDESNDWLQSGEKELDINEIRRNHKIKTHTLLNHRPLSFGSFDYQDCLADITFTNCYNYDR